eukprot:12119920-Prorocentrum_lima.AAC.1
MTSSLVGSEMCIRDSRKISNWGTAVSTPPRSKDKKGEEQEEEQESSSSTVSYTHLTLPTICSV